MLLAGQKNLVALSGARKQGGIGPIAPTRDYR